MRVQTQTVDLQPGAVYGIEAAEEFPSIHKNEFFSFGEEKAPFLFSPPHLSPRVTVQNAVFTVHGAPATPWEPENLKIFEIPGNLFQEFQMTLNLAGINEGSLFSDLDEIARHIGKINNLTSF